MSEEEYKRVYRARVAQWRHAGQAAVLPEALLSFKGLDRRSPEAALISVGGTACRSRSIPSHSALTLPRSPSILRPARSSQDHAFDSRASCLTDAPSWTGASGDVSESVSFKEDSHPLQCALRVGMRVSVITPRHATKEVSARNGVVQEVSKNGECSVRYESGDVEHAVHIRRVVLDRGELERQKGPWISRKSVIDSQTLSSWEAKAGSCPRELGVTSRKPGVSFSGGRQFRSRKKDVARTKLMVSTLLQGN